jgi:hypothetical protein
MNNQAQDTGTSSLARLHPPTGHVTNLAKDAIQHAQAEIVKAMASSKAAIQAVVRHPICVPATDAIQDEIQQAIEQAMRAQQDAIQTAQDKALQAISAAVANYSSPNSAGHSTTSGQP